MTQALLKASDELWDEGRLLMSVTLLDQASHSIKAEYGLLKIIRRQENDPS